VQRTWLLAFKHWWIWDCEKSSKRWAAAHCMYVWEHDLKVDTINGCGGIFNIVLLQIFHRVCEWKNCENPLRIDKVIDMSWCTTSLWQSVDSSKPNKQRTWTEQVCCTHYEIAWDRLSETSTHCHSCHKTLQEMSHRAPVSQTYSTVKNNRTEQPSTTR